MTGKISYYREDATGQLGDPHQLGTTQDGRRLYQFVEGWTPVDSDGNPVDVECDESGNWIEPDAD